MQYFHPQCTVAHNAVRTTCRVRSICSPARRELGCIYCSSPSIVVLYTTYKTNFKTLFTQQTVEHMITRCEAVYANCPSPLLHLSKLRTNLGSKSRIPICPTVKVCTSCNSHVLHSKVNRFFLRGRNQLKSCRNRAFSALQPTEKELPRHSNFKFHACHTS